MVACWRGVARTLDGSRGQAGLFGQQGGACAGADEGAATTWTAPAPSPSYDLVAQLDKQSKKGPKIPDSLKNDLHAMRDRLIEHQEVEKSRKEAELRPRPGAEPPPERERWEVTITEQASGKRKPQSGDSVRIGYSVVLEEDAQIVDMCPDFEYVLGGAKRGAGEATAEALERLLVQLHRGQVASARCLLGDLLPPEAPQVKEHGAEARAVCEVQLFEIYTTRDCSFQKGEGVVFKEVIKEGVGAWCDTTSDEGTALLRVEEVATEDGTRLFPLCGDVPLELWVTPGDGQVCDALECAMLEMRQHETALVTCKDPAYFADGLPELEVAPGGGAVCRVTLLDYTKGPDVWSFSEEDRVPFAARRKAVANALFKKGRYRLARERYSRIVELFHHLDRPKGGIVSPVRDRFLGKPELAQSCKELRTACRLNVAACCLKLGDPAGAKQACDAVLLAEPENAKALYRRAQAHVRRQDFAEACRDLERLLDADGGCEEARVLLKKTQNAQEVSDRQQRRGSFRYGAMFDGIDDPRSTKWDYASAPMDAPGMEGAPISSQYTPKKPRAIKA